MKSIEEIILENSNRETELELVEEMMEVITEDK